MEFIRVEDCCEILDSQRKPVTESERISGMYPYYGANGMQGTINQYIFDDKLVLVAEDGGHFGSKTKPIAYLVNGKCWVNNHAHVLRAKKGFLVEYICYSLMFYKIEGYINGATRQKLTQAALRKLIIPKRSEEYQKAIVERLDLVKCIIKNKQIIIKELDQLIKSRFVEMFGDPVINNKKWATMNLHEISIKITSGNTPQGGSRVYINHGVLFIRSQNVWNNRLDLDDVVYISESLNEKMKETRLRKNDLLITKTGRFNTENSSLGRCALYTGPDFQANINGHVYLVRLKTEYNPNFILSILTSEAYKNLIRTVCVGGIDKRQLNKSHIELFPIIIPPIELQNQYIQFLFQINKLKFAQIVYN